MHKTSHNSFKPPAPKGKDFKETIAFRFTGGIIYHVLCHLSFSDPLHRDCPLDCKVYVGNLGNNGNKTELERTFGYYGPLRSVWVARNPPGFAFVEFEDPRDASDAVRELDGR